MKKGKVRKSKIKKIDDDVWRLQDLKARYAIFSL